jgi:alpha-D-ribose 1-methylphosphonate 5-triphosphate synthase subunit PhnG
MLKMSSLDRKMRLSTLAYADPASLTERWSGWCSANGAPEHDVLREPEIGTVMVRGRAGAVGTPFNLGEITVTRTSVKLTSGTVGHGYVQGHDKAASHAAALIDALGQTALADDMDQAVTIPLAAAAQAQATRRSAKAATTKVDFFTVVRGHD